MSKLKGILLVGAFLFAFSIAVIAGYNAFKEPIQERFGLADSGFLDNGTDVIGTKTATTTVGVAFGKASTGGISATSTYVTKIVPADKAVYTIQNLIASSTSRINIEIQGSQDDFCDTTATSGGNLPLVSEINWFSAGDHLRGKIQTTSFVNASSTNFISWLNPLNGAGQEIILENLDYECLRLNIAAASSTVWAQISTR